MKSKMQMRGNAGQHTHGTDEVSALETDVLAYADSSSGGAHLSLSNTSRMMSKMHGEEKRVRKMAIEE